MHMQTSATQVDLQMLYSGSPTNNILCPIFTEVNLSHFWLMDQGINLVRLNVAKLRCPNLLLLTSCLELILPKFCSKMTQLKSIISC